MPYSIEYFHPKVLAEIESWPADILADYARIAELLMGRRAVVLHAFVKKSQQTPDRELKLARKRMKEVLHG
jgi:phage-related protein